MTRTEYTMAREQNAIADAVRRVARRTARELGMPLDTTTYRVMSAACANAAQAFVLCADADVELGLGDEETFR